MLIASKYGLVRKQVAFVPALFITECSNNSLELNIHQRILSDIASLKDTRDDLLFAKELIASKVETREDLEEQQAQEGHAADGDVEPRVFMVRA